MLVGNPVPRAGYEIEIFPTDIAEDILNGSLLWRIEWNACYVGMHAGAVGIDHPHIIANMQIAVTSKHGWKRPWTVHVPINKRAAPFAWLGTASVTSQN